MGLVLDFSAKTLRRSFVTRMLPEGTSTRTVQELLEPGLQWVGSSQRSVK
jgi:site-specific recombinase XerD